VYCELFEAFAFEVAGAAATDISISCYHNHRFLSFPYEGSRTTVSLLTGTLEHRKREHL